MSLFMSIMPHFQSYQIAPQLYTFRYITHHSKTLRLTTIKHIKKVKKNSKIVKITQTHTLVLKVGIFLKREVRASIGLVLNSCS